MPMRPDLSPSPSRRWGRYVELAVWAALAGLLLYRCVLPVPSAPLGPEAAATRVAVAGRPMMIEFSASR